jgi:regulator of protease activity HflC (stomatin/prohibitin superfamily)
MGLVDKRPDSIVIQRQLWTFAMSWLVGLSVVILYLWSTINILKEYERGVVFRLGRLVPAAMGPGLVFILWAVYKMVRVSLRTVTLEVPPQDIISRDNVSLKANAII